MNNTLIFAGHFELGERITPVQHLTIQTAQRLPGRLAVVVNDIGFTNKCLVFLRNGLIGVKEEYLQRMVCATTGCTLSQLPAPEELDQVIDVNLFQAVSTQYQAWRIGFDHEPTKSEINIFFSSTIIPQVIHQRLKEYGLNPVEVKIYSEKQLRNRAELRMRRERANSQKSWLKLLTQAEQQKSLVSILMPEVKKNSGMPSCRGILLALYEQVALEGFTQIIQLYEQKQYLAIQQASDLYSAIHSAFPADPRWCMDIQNHFFTDQGEVQQVDLEQFEVFPKRARLSATPKSV